MSKMNNKGFLLAETLIVTTFVLTVLIYLFAQFKNLTIEFKKSYKYNTVQDIYNLGSVSKFITENKIMLTNGTIIYNNDTCQNIPDENKPFCSEIAQKMDAEYILYEDSNINNVKQRKQNYDQDMQDFIERINTKNIEGKGRIFAKFKNGNFATIVTEKYKTSLIKAWPTNNPSTDFHNNQYKTKITSVEFLNNTIIPSSVPNNHKWDVSQNNDKSVMAWITDDGAGGYNLYIGGDGGVLANQDSSDLFYGFTALRTIDFTNYDASGATKMAGMLYGCTGLTELDLSNLDTRNVTDMGSMFSNCTGLRQLHLGGAFVTNNVENMILMFNNCSSLTSLDLRSFDTSKVEKISGLFQDCKSLASVDLSSFDTSKVTTLNNMFRDCDELTELDLSSFNTQDVTDMSYMFFSCNKLEKIYVSDAFVTNNVSSSNIMFTGDNRLVGGNGTTYDNTKTDKEYAKIDKPGQKGYFTQR